MIQQSTLPVMEHFYTLQGEGSHSGRAAYFIRLAGCDVGCVWCDVKESWDISPNQYLTIENIVAAVGQTPTDFVVITGGEPTMHNLTELTSALH
ncbi:MAG: 7-carboxy-7-deazaguanine synthase QueE, partial [Crocinitomicaceae bacterium]|nr:7-carboxy-7-deazaguanine synthase QueE [Crocinitomicaceae bacterium]